MFLHKGMQGIRSGGLAEGRGIINGGPIDVEFGLEYVEVDSAVGGY